MRDRKPPRLAADERAALTALLDYQRQSFARKVGGADPGGAGASPVASGTSLLWLANHMADAEITWVLRRFAGRPGAGADFPPADDLAAAVDRYRAVWRAVDPVVAAAGLDDGCPPFDDGPAVNLRWILLHLLEETARHAGHADILRELLDGHTGR